MSKIGKKPVEVPQGVNVEKGKGVIILNGPKGKLTVPVNENLLNVEITDGKIIVSRKNDEKFTKSLHGTVRQLINNAVYGVLHGYEKSLDVVGVGYKVSQKSRDTIELDVGYSHPVIYKVPPGINIKVDGNRITVSGCDKQLVGEVAARIRRIKPPDAYKGKGIRYADEVLKLKPGKQAAKK